MTDGSQASPAETTNDSRSVSAFLKRMVGAGRPMSAWRVGTPLVVVICGGLFVVSAISAHGTDLRPGRYTDLSQLVQGDSERYQRLEKRVSAEQAEVDRLTSAVTDDTVKKYNKEAKQLADPAGTSEVDGTGVRIVLSDSPSDVQKHSSADPNDLVVHQQDIQAVVNALWAGGAQAVSVAGRRIITTTGIKCSGGTVQLDGVPYPQPFVIDAVGDQTALDTALSQDQHVALYLEQSQDPDIAIGWSAADVGFMQIPAYTGLLDVHYAEPLDQTS